MGEANAPPFLFLPLFTGVRGIGVPRTSPFGSSRKSIYGIMHIPGSRGPETGAGLDHSHTTSTNILWRWIKDAPSCMEEDRPRGCLIARWGCTAALGADCIAHLDDSALARRRSTAQEGSSTRLCLSVMISLSRMRTSCTISSRMSSTMYRANSSSEMSSPSILTFYVEPEALPLQAASVGEVHLEIELHPPVWRVRRHRSPPFSQRVSLNMTHIG